MCNDISTEHATLQGGPRRLSKGVKALVEASAAEAEAISCLKGTTSQWSHVTVVAAAETSGALGGMVRQLSIDQFENEGRRVSHGTPESAIAARRLLDRQMSINSVPRSVMEFCNNNDLQLNVRAHECVMDGFECFAQGHLIALFSATNYCGTANNAGAILVLGRDLVVVPKLIHPLPPAIDSPEASPERHTEDSWMQELNANRPPTPTRGRPQTSTDRGSLAWM
ncbi:hypothetical protein ZIOFF_025218 [Zingiber officinale]|uniref:Uncharacterized protein n=1 Tax=Zingiber officinale TaxID=94328 RepID=A0A8J5H0I4_ZINOF|nr:hypothetical protein ZIOFF_025218 [Zingiber officinale]